MSELHADTTRNPADQLRCFGLRKFFLVDC